jgi:triosephosphate isomerase
MTPAGHDVCVATAPLDQPLVGAGLKMFLGYAETVRYLWSLAEFADEFEGVSVFVLPSFPALAQARLALTGSRVLYGAQDGHWEERGPYTGAVSPAMLRELGCTFMEVGHAERRQQFSEDDSMVGRKAAAAARCGLIPIVCVGEEHEGIDALARVCAQARAALTALGDDAAVVFAYEPVWAIGAKSVADPGHVADVVDALRLLVAGRSGSVRILYGGSVSPGHVERLLDAGIDGLFVARSALRVDDLRRIVAKLVASR